MSGWIKLQRQLKEWEWYRDLPTKSLFLHLLISANHKPIRWQGLDVKAGQLVVGRKSLAHETGLSEQQIRTALDKLKATSEITITSTSKYSIVSITKWELYQSDQPAPQPASNQQSTTNKNEKNVKKKEDIYSDAFTEAWPIYPSLRRGDMPSAWKAWQGAIKKGYTETQILEGVKKYAASDEASGSYAKGYAAWLNGNRFTWTYKPVGSAQGGSAGKRSGFDSLATAAAKISEDVEGQELDILRRTDPNLYLQRLLDKSRGTDGIAGSLDAPNTVQHDAALTGIGYPKESGSDGHEQ